MTGETRSSFFAGWVLPRMPAALHRLHSRCWCILLLLVTLAAHFVAPANLSALGSVEAAPSHGRSRVAIATAPTSTRSGSSWQWQDLGGTKWSLSNSNGTISVPATVPGNVYSDLLEAGVLDGDPYYRDNEAYFQWVVFDDWTYTRVFDLDDGFAQHASIELECEGIDTVATLTLNGVRIGSTKNMHLRYYFDVKALLKPTGNKLVVTIASPVEAGRKASAAYPYPVPTSDGPIYLPYRNFIRKAQSDGGWDWGPSFAPSGIWQPIRLLGVHTSWFAHVVVHQHHAREMTSAQRLTQNLVDGDVLLHVATYFRVAPGTPAGTVCATLPRGGDKIMPSRLLTNCTPQTLGPKDLLGEQVTDVWLTVRAPDVELWWPNGYGAQPLFRLEVAYADDAQRTFDRRLRTIGFKTVQLVREAGPAGQNGRSFYFRVNGLPIYIKGANMIPVDAFHTRVTDANATLPLQSLVEAHGNTVRIWGGGIYQRDAVYRYADEHGLLVWQEFAFACAMYPRDKAFLALARAEVAHQTRRLSSHASILVLGGNNENEAALGWFGFTRQQRDVYLLDYAKLFVDTVREQVLDEIGHTLPFVTSSPSRGPQSEEPYTQLWGEAQSNDDGDIHYYNYDADCADVSQLPRPRFVSEFGFQSLPSVYTWSPVTEPADLAWNSTLMQYRQRHPQGNEQLLAQMARHFRVPDDPSAPEQFSRMVFLTQAVQSLCYTTALEHWRRIKHETPGRTMGVLYWQLNDVWQGPTWSSLEYGGRWKQLHYAVARSFAPVLASGYYDRASDQVYMYLTSDVARPLVGTYSYTIHSWLRGNLTTRLLPALALAPLDSMRIFNASAHALFAEAECDSFAECFLTVRFEYEDANDAQAATSDNPIFLTPLRDTPVPRNANFTLSHFAPMIESWQKWFLDDDSLTKVASFQLATNEAAAYVFLSTSLLGRFSDNAFIMSPRSQRTITFTAFDQPFSLAQLQASLVVESV